jgi:glycosyltransferase involved in cell wall biosynthesis
MYKEQLKQLVEDKLKKIPHGVDLNKFYQKEKPIDKFRFLINKGWRNNEDRGGTQYGIKAYLEEFTNKDNVELIVKINPGIPDLNKLIKELVPKDKNNLPLIQIIVENLPYDKLVDLYNRGNVFVSPTRAEAFNIPGIEAQACGVPTIQTRYGGQIDYMKEDIDFFIDYDLTEVEWELEYEGINFATPKIEHLKKIMRYCYENQNEIKERGLKAINNSHNFTWDLSIQKILSLV